MSKLSVLVILFFGFTSYVSAMLPVQAQREWDKLAEIGTVRGNTITITKEQLEQAAKRDMVIAIPVGYAKSMGGALATKKPKKVANGFYYYTAQLVADGLVTEAIISRQEYKEALEESGPFAAAMTNPYGDGCTIM